MTIVGGVPFQIPGLLALYPNACIIVSAAFGADLAADPATWVWTDITTDVRQADGGFITISPMGRSDETSTAQPAGCSFELDNLSGNYTAYNPASTHYPYVRRNTPIKVEINLTGNPADTRTRFEGYATGWKPSWDIAAALPVVTVTAQGITRRLAQGKNPLRSPIYRSVTPRGPRAYWPMEDGAGAATLASAVVGKDPLTITGVTPAADSTLGGSQPLPRLDAGATITGTLNPSDYTGGVWEVEWIFYLPAVPAAPTVLFRVDATGGTVARWEYTADGTFPDVYTWTGYDATGATAITWSFTAPLLLVGEWIRMRFSAKQNGGNVDVILLHLPASTSTGTGGFHSTSFAGTVGAPTRMSTPSSTGVANLVTGHWASFDVYNIASSDGASAGWTGETATNRLIRLCQEEGIAINITGTTVTTMGPQPTDTFLNLLRECETADQGVLYDGLGPGLGYVTRDARYALAATLTADMGVDPPQLADPFEPVDDDQRTRNVAKVDRKNGTSYTYTQTAGALGTAAIGVYDTSLTVNVDSDSVVPSYASWLTHTGTVEGFRYPTLNFDLAAVPLLATSWLAATVSSRVDVKNVSSRAQQHPAGTVRLLLEGWSEQLSPYDWAARANTSQYEPWRVGQLATTSGDTNRELGHLDTDGSTTSGSTAPGATTITVAVNAGPRWTTTADDFPFDVLIGGQRISIASITGTSSPQTFNVDPTGSQVLYTIPSGTAVTVADPIILAL